MTDVLELLSEGGLGNMENPSTWQEGRQEGPREAGEGEEGRWDT